VTYKCVERDIKPDNTYIAHNAACVDITAFPPFITSASSRLLCSLAVDLVLGTLARSVKNFQARWRADSAWRRAVGCAGRCVQPAARSRAHFQLDLLPGDLENQQTHTESITGTALRQRDRRTDRQVTATVMVL